MFKRICFIYITCSDKKEAEKIALALVNEKLAACANIIPRVVSVFSWKGWDETLSG